MQNGLLCGSVGSCYCWRDHSFLSILVDIMKVARLRRELLTLRALCNVSLGTGKVCHNSIGGGVKVTTRNLQPESIRRIANVSDRVDNLLLALDDER